MIRPSMLIKHSPDRTPGSSGWQKSAACIDVDPEMFFIPGQGDAWEHRGNEFQLGLVRAVCASCTVVAECLADAYAVGDKDSFRGALTPYEREKLKRNGKRKSQAKEKGESAKPIPCDQCDREFVNRGALMGHMASHRTECLNGHDVTVFDARNPSGQCRECKRNADARREADRKSKRAS